MTRSIHTQLAAATLVSCTGILAGNARADHYLPAKIGWHAAVYNRDSKHPKLDPWTTWDDALRREIRWYLRCPVDSHGYPQIVFTTFMDGDYQPYKSDIITATQNGMGILSYLKYWRYRDKSDPLVPAMARTMGDHLVRETLTPDRGPYPRFTRSTGNHTSFPLSSSSQGDLSNGRGVIEPDKGGIDGYALIELYKATHDPCCLNQTIHNADVLANNMREGDALHSPWPFLVDSVTGEHLGARSGNMVYVLRLFDELIAMDKNRYQDPRDALWNWIVSYQLAAGEDYYTMAYRNLSWVTCFIRDDGVVCDKTSEWDWLREGGRQEDCHTDVVHNFMDAIAACPQFACLRTLPLPRPPRHGGVYVVAHRGAHQGIPENSLAAYQKAIDLGADFVEIDVRTTKDGKFVSIHNGTINAYVKGQVGNVHEMTLAELKALDIGERIGPEWKGTRIPSLDEILALCHGKIGIYLDLKDGPVDSLAAIIRQRGMQRDVIWYASVEQLKELRRVCPDCIPMPDPHGERQLDYVIRAVRPTVIASTFDDLSPSFLQTSHAASAIVIADESDPGDWQRALEWGLDGIQTDHPAKLIEWLKQRSGKHQGGVP